MMTGSLEDTQETDCDCGARRGAS